MPADHMVSGLFFAWQPHTLALSAKTKAGSLGCQEIFIRLNQEIAD